MKEDVLQKDVNNLSESSSIETAFHDSYVLSKQEETFFFSDMHLTCTVLITFLSYEKQYMKTFVFLLERLNTVERE
jgi:hypothetical protein